MVTIPRRTKTGESLTAYGTLTRNAGTASASPGRPEGLRHIITAALDAVFHPDRDRLAEPFNRPVLVVTDLHAEPVLAPLQLHFHAV